MSKEQHNIEDLFRDSFDGFMVDPSPSLWKRLAGRLAWKRFWGFSFRTLNVYNTGIAAVLILLLAFSFTGTSTDNYTDGVVLAPDPVAEKALVDEMLAGGPSEAVTDHQPKKSKPLVPAPTTADMPAPPATVNGADMPLVETGTSLAPKAKGHIMEPGQPVVNDRPTSTTASQRVSETQTQPIKKQQPRGTVAQAGQATRQGASPGIAKAERVAPSQLEEPVFDGSPTQAHEVTDADAARLIAGAKQVHQPAKTSVPIALGSGGAGVGATTVNGGQGLGLLPTASGWQGAQPTKSRTLLLGSGKDMDEVPVVMNRRMSLLNNEVQRPGVDQQPVAPRQWPTLGLRWFLEASAGSLMTEYNMSETVQGKPRQYLDGGGIKQSQNLGRTFSVLLGVEKNRLSLEAGLAYAQYRVNLKVFENSSYYVAGSNSYYVATNNSKLDTLGWDFVYEYADGNLNAPHAGDASGQLGELGDVEVVNGGDYLDVVVVDSIPIVGTNQNRTDSVLFNDYTIGRMDVYRPCTYTFTYLQLPVFVGISRNYGRFSTKGRFGLITELLLQSKGPQLDSGNVQQATGNSRLLKLNFSAYASVQVACRLGAGFDLFAEPFFQTTTRSIYDKSHAVSLKLKSYGLKTGVCYRF